MGNRMSVIEELLLPWRKSTPSDKLCSICRKVSFQILQKSLCIDCISGNRVKLAGFSDIFKLGTVKRTLKNRSCPACRLISCCISSFSDILSPDGIVSLYPVPYHMEATRTEDNEWSDWGCTNCIYIVVCAHNISPKSGLYSNIATPCRVISIGSLLPTMLHENKGIPPRIDFDTKPTENLVKRRYVYARHVNPQIDVELIRGWMNRCISKHHTGCRARHLNPSALASLRLIDVRKKRIIMGDFGHDFVALSYVWGSNTKPVLTQSTKDKYLEIGSLSRVNVPPTIWDIMDLVSDLGEQYLWVDSVCIVQDELSDKRKYLPIMGEIYDNAKLVVVAAVKDAHSGIPGRGDNQRRWTRNTERIQGIDFTNGGPMLCHRLETTTWNTRGWTYQEAQLARRALIITDSQVYWNCREETWREERFAEFQNLRFVPASQDSLFTGTAPEALGRGYALTTVPCSLGTYCDKVYEFSMRLFTDSRDALWACVGILKSLLPEFPQGYIWGIPKVNLDAALLWEAYGPWKYREPLKIPIPIANGGWQELMIPSWSWISEASTVRYSVCRVRVKPMVEWHDPVPFEKLGLLSETREREQEGMESPQSTIFLDQLSSERSIFDFALLHFTAQSTILKIRRPLSLKPVTGCIHYIVRAKIGLLSGRNIGSIRIPLGTFSGHNEIQGEFLLLSRSGTDQYGHELEEQKYNIMLIRWSDDNKLAYRVTWTEVRKSDWEECETQRKTIILG